MASGNERALAGVLIAEAVVLLCALPAAVMPTAWMAWWHERLGLGPMPAGPLVEYLTRSVSLVYGLLGPVLLVLASDVPRYRPLIRAVGWVHVAAALGLMAIDGLSGLPLWWLWVEGPAVLGLGVALVVLAGRGVSPA